MSQSKNRAPISLAGIQGGGMSPDGDFILFTLEARGGRIFTFSIPHEAVGEIVSGILALSDRAAALRPKGGPDSGERHRIERAFPLERFLVSGSLDGDGKVGLTLYARGTEHSILIERPDAQKMGEALLDAVKRTAN